MPPSPDPGERAGPDARTQSTEGDRGLDDLETGPRLQWRGKSSPQASPTDLDLEVQEVVNPREIVAGLRPTPGKDQADTNDGGDPFPVFSHEFPEGWHNRLILGDSVHVMAALGRREELAGKVQTIYFDPPYGIEYKANFQVSVTSRRVRHKQDASLTREPEQIKAYRDTWQDGVHSFLTHIRERVALMRELLHPSGSLFVQMGSDHVHLVRAVLDEVFGPENHVDTITLQKTSGFATKLLPSIADYLLWYARDKDQVKYHQLFLPKTLEDVNTTVYRFVEEADGTRRRLTPEELQNLKLVPPGARIYRIGDLTSQGAVKRKKGNARSGKGSSGDPFTFEGKTYNPGRNAHWKTTGAGLQNLAEARRIQSTRSKIYYVRFFDDFPIKNLTNIWTDTGVGGFTEPKVYVVQTNEKIVQRCLLMTSDPGDLVFDPTCGSGTTAHVAEEWGRRWITCDTSRVALYLARRRLLTGVFPAFEYADPTRGVAGGFTYQTARHLKLSHIAKQLSVETETLYDQPVEVPGRVRVTGPFQVEGCVASTRAGEAGVEAPGKGEKEEEGDELAARREFLDRVYEALSKDGVTFPGGQKIHLEDLTFHPGPPRPLFPITGSFPASVPLPRETPGSSPAGPARVGVSVGPEYGPVDAGHVDATLSAAADHVDVVIFTGFAFNSRAQAHVERWRHAHARPRVILVHVNPDLHLQDLLRATRDSELFTAMGSSTVRCERLPAGSAGLEAGDPTGDVPPSKLVVELESTSSYDPLAARVVSRPGDEAIAWFLDAAFDGEVFHVQQAFFPTGRDPWKKLRRACRKFLARDRFDDYRGRRSLPVLEARVETLAIKVVDARGNESLFILPRDGIPSPEPQAQ